MCVTRKIVVLSAARTIRLAASVALYMLVAATPIRPRLSVKIIQLREKGVERAKLGRPVMEQMLLAPIAGVRTHLV
jgi:hypothetical protein